MVKKNNKQEILLYPKEFALSNSSGCAGTLQYVRDGGVLGGFVLLITAVVFCSRCKIHPGVA